MRMRMVLQAMRGSGPLRVAPGLTAVKIAHGGM